KQAKTQRGLTYSHYWSPPSDGKPVLLFSHGFPSASFLWRRQVAFFEPLGYGVLVPDNLGYGGTDKPTDPKMYIGSGFAQDMADILDAEGLSKVIAIGHDWGCRVVSRLTNYHPHRVSACAFTAIGYSAPFAAGTDPISAHAQITKAIGYDAFAYMRFFVQPDAVKLIETNIDSFISLLYPATPNLWKENVCVEGGARAWIESGKTASLPAHMTSEDTELLKNSLLSGGLAAPLCWYRQFQEKASSDDEAKISAAAAGEIKQPLLFVAFKDDPLGVPARVDANHAKYAKGPVTRREIEGDHWALQSHATELNTILLEWLEGLNL
ncbi:alpha/beta-hydrolase, partial [Mycena polygramma]